MENIRNSAESPRHTHTRALAILLHRSNLMVVDFSPSKPWPVQCAKMKTNALCDALAGTCAT